MKTLYMMYGLPASGKTTRAKELLRELRRIIASHPQRITRQQTRRADFRTMFPAFSEQHDMPRKIRRVIVRDILKRDRALEKADAAKVRAQVDADVEQVA